MIDCTDRAYAGAVVIYTLYASQYGIFQNMIIYVLGTLTNEPRKTAAMGGLFVGGKQPCFGIKSSSLTFFSSELRDSNFIRDRCNIAAV
jgi:hypothetical protein